MARTHSPAFSLQVGPHGEEALVVSRFTGTEALSQPYEFSFEFHERDGQPLVMADLLNTPALLTVRLGEGAVRHVHGWVYRAESAGRVNGRWHYRVWVGPQLLRLKHVRKSRIFQGKSTPEVVKSILEEAGVELRLALQGSYEPREYCVQYRESDFDFISRLLEWEGISYFFQHSEQEHTLVLADSAGAHEALPGGASLPLYAEDGRVAEGEYLSSLELAWRLRPGAVHLKDYDFEKPAVDTSAKASSPSGTSELELYEYPGEYTPLKVGKAAAKVRMEERAQAARTLSGEGVCPRLTPGHLFEVDAPGDGAFAGEYLVVEVVHAAHQPDTQGNAEALQSLCHTQFRLLPKGVPFRPRRATPVPHIAGVQTATVVGPSGEEIHTDAHGRIKVQFHWDREGGRDDKSSCWVRVGQPWGGPAWGHLYLPRLGQEVLVRFLEGNPDRPLIAGTLYNGTNVTPYPLPDDKTTSTLKSASSPGSNGFNELRLEDAAGEEEVYVHGQKDESLLTENDKSQRVEGFEDLWVKKDRKRTVEGHQRLSVNQHEASLVEGHQGLQVRGNRETGVRGGHEESVEGNQSVTIAKGFTSTVAQAAAENVGAAKALNVGAGYAINVALAMNEAVGGLKSTEVAAVHSEYVLGSRQEVIANNRQASVGGDFQSEVGGQWSLTVGKDAKEDVGARSELSVKEATAWLASKFELKADKFSLIVNDKLILSIEKSGKAQLFAKSLTLDGSEVKFKGSKVKLEAAGSLKSKSEKFKDITKLDEQKAKENTLEFVLKDESGQPITHQEFEVELPDGTVKKGKVDGSGKARLEGIPPGQHRVTFPGLEGVIPE